MIELIRSASDANPEAPAVLSDRSTISYGQLLEQAEALALGLSMRSLSRVACVVADPTTLIPLLAATAAVGCEACTYPPQLHESGIDELAGAFGHTVVLSDRNLELAQATVIPIDELLTSGTTPLAATPPATPLLVLTTGTTARPKAARHDWARLATPALKRAGSANERWLLAFNLNKFAGLQVLLHVLASGATLVVPSSIQPRDALSAMLKYRVTHLDATPTFWRFLVALLNDGVSTVPELRQATLGGEAASTQLLSDVRRLFPHARVSHVYTSTEVGSGVSVGDGQQGLPLAILSRPEDAEVQFRIVDGQLEARSSIGMLGYHGDDEVAEGGWRGTGDLVEICDDRIVFVGRASETINVGGVKVHPLAIEDVVGAVDGVRLVRAYARANPVSGQIVVIDVVMVPGRDREAVEDAIRSACQILAPAAQPRRVRFVDELDLREQKIARS